MPEQEEATLQTEGVKTIVLIDTGAGRSIASPLAFFASGEVSGVLCYLLCRDSLETP